MRINVGRGSGNSKENWKESLRRYFEMEKEVNEQKLRFDAKFIPVNVIAKQFYCEKKVELEHLYGEIETEEIKQGKAGHEALLEGAERVSAEKLWEDIHKKESVGAVMPLVGKHQGCLIKGVPDYILFSRGRPLALVEHKFSNNQTIFPQYHVQANVYGYLLHCMGFDTGSLRYAIALMPRETIGRDFRSIDYLLSLLVAKMKVDGATKVPALPFNDKSVVWAYPFSLEKAIEEIDWALGFWLNEREAKPTQKPRKCASCTMREHCDCAL